MVKLRTVLGLVISVLVVGCTANVESVGQSQESLGTDQALPLRGTLAGPLTSSPTGRCADAFGPTIGTSTQFAEGELSHLGATVHTSTHCVPPFTNLPHTSHHDGELVWTAANGDEVHATYFGDGILDFSTLTLRAQSYVTITGGTGRFEDASGDAVAHAVANVATSQVTFEIEGWIDY